MSPDQERWAEALMVNRIHGARASLHVTDRIAALERADDRAGVTRWREIGARLDRLIQPETVQ